METDEVVIRKVQKWLEAEGKSYKWLSEQLGISKSLVGFILKGERPLKPERIAQLAKLINTTTKELLQPEIVKKDTLTVNLRGELTNRRSHRELDSLLFAINDYIGLKEQVKQCGQKERGRINS
ncbi:helix-turn-helix domain-containing protein (plasmid) [Lysinibacillus sp. fkY74-1]|uniref:helix-turn-helix domain-containing protein n=1 Tax=Lysinibacillus fusiformis TaxID=28031 RepID=UPI0023AA028F|nr:helix-turn-helix transcriptional regulator [Lysinibacillus fusiformis]WEA41697.1 helix-turn-helix transcriptional regulator [Lysinibacillus fusiformis]